MIAMQELVQPALFEPGPLVLAEDPEGGIVYRPGFVESRVAERWFDALRDQVQWQAQRRPMYDRVVDVPRLVASLRWDDASSPSTLPAAITEAATLLRRELGVAFDSVGLNQYRDGRDSVAPHSDKLHLLMPGQPIALVSLGAARRMTIRQKQPPRSAQYLDLAPGSLLLMSHASQFHYDHGIPKTGHEVAPRISMAFRVRPRSQGSRVAPLASSD